MAGPVTPLVEDKLYALHNPYELNGFVSTHPTDARGFAPLNAYLLIEGNRGILVDTGFSIHEESLIAQIASIVPEDLTLSIFPMTIGEFSGICNVRPVVDHFAVDIVYGITGTPAAWTDFRPEYAPYGGPVGHGSLAEVGAGYVHSTDEIHWAPSGRMLEILPPPVQAIPDNWCYDAPTKTLFTGDSFNHVWRATADGPWVIQPDEPLPSLEQVYEFLTTSRYWWLPGARTDELIADLRRVFEEHEVERIAPRFGCVIDDPSLVAAHYDLLENVLLESQNREPASVHTGLEPMGGRAA